MKNFQSNTYSLLLKLATTAILTVVIIDALPATAISLTAGSSIVKAKKANICKNRAKRDNNSSSLHDGDNSNRKRRKSTDCVLVPLGGLGAVGSLGALAGLLGSGGGDGSGSASSFGSGSGAVPADTLTDNNNGTAIGTVPPPQQIPEPCTIFGSLIAGGLSWLMQRKVARS